MKTKLFIFTLLVCVLAGCSKSEPETTRDITGSYYYKFNDVRNINIILNHNDKAMILGSYYYNSLTNEYIKKYTEITTYTFDDQYVYIDRSKLYDDGTTHIEAYKYDEQYIYFEGASLRKGADFFNP